MFGEQTLRDPAGLGVAADLFNAKTGYAYPSNGWLAENTLIAEKKVPGRRLADKLEGGRRDPARLGEPQRPKAARDLPGDRHPATPWGDPPRWGRGGTPSSRGPIT